MAAQAHGLSAPPSPDVAPPTAEPSLPPWAVVGGDFYGHRDWRIEAIVGQWLRLIEKKSRAEPPNEAWIYLPTGVVYGNTTLLRRTEHGVPTITR